MTSLEKWHEAREAAKALVAILKRDSRSDTIVASAESALKMIAWEEANAIAWDRESHIPYYGG